MDLFFILFIVVLIVIATGIRHMIKINKRNRLINEVSARAEKVRIQNDKKRAIEANKVTSLIETWPIENPDKKLPTDQHELIDKIVENETTYYCDSELIEVWATSQPGELKAIKGKYAE